MAVRAQYIYATNGDLIKQYNGLNAGGEFGYSVAAIGDQDGDLKEDVLIGERVGSTISGSVYIYSSSTGDLLKQIDGEHVLDAFGSSVSSISDQDGDGKDDVVAGAPNYFSVTGSTPSYTYVYSSNPLFTGSDSGNLIKKYTSESIGDAFGISVASIDLDSDGKNESVLIGATGYSPIGQEQVGAVYLYSQNGTLIRRYSSGVDRAYFGNSVSSISDIDGDNKDDIIIGSRLFDGNILINSGGAYLYSSGTGNLIKQYNGIYYGDYLGSSVAPISDMDGDGKADIIAGASNTDPSGKTDAGSVYLFSTAGAPAQSWSKSTSKSNAFDLDTYFIDPNNSTIPARNQTSTYSASTADNPNVDVSIDSTTHEVSFSQPSWWAGSETVTFTATDSTGLISTSNPVILTVTGTSDISAPTNIGISTIATNSTTQLTITTTTATDTESGLSATPYQFQETTGNAGSSSSDWQSGTTFIDSGLSPCTNYRYKVRSKDAAGNISDYSPFVEGMTAGCTSGGNSYTAPPTTTAPPTQQPTVTPPAEQPPTQTPTTTPQINTMTEQQRTTLISQIKQQLVVLITQLIQLLTQQAGQMGK